MNKNTQICGIARIRFTNDKLQTIWSLPVFYRDIVDLQHAVMDAPNVPRGTVCDFQFLGNYDMKLARIIPAPRKTFILKGVCKSGSDNSSHLCLDRAAEAREPVDSSSANVSVEGDCE